MPDRSPQILQTLTSHGLINKNISLDQLNTASQQIGSLIGVTAAGEWTFISPNYVYKGGVIDKNAVINVDTHAKVLNALSTNGIINKTTTLDQIVAASNQIVGLAGLAHGEWTFVSPNFVYKGSNPVGDIGIARPL